MSGPAITRRELPLRLLCFAVRGAELAVAATDVEEIVPLGTVTPVPGVPVHVTGVQPLRGQALPLLDLGAFLGLPEAPDGRAPAPRVLVASAPPYRVGLLVERVHGVVGIDELTSRDLELLEPAPVRARSVAALDRGGSVAALLDLLGLLEAARA